MDCISENTAPHNPFSIEFKQTVLQPSESTEATISFIPRDAQIYSHVFTFELNGLTRRDVLVKGVGTELRIELADPKQKLLDMGTLQVGKSSKRTVKLTNRSLAPIDFNLSFEPKSDALKSNKSVLQLTPSQKLKLKPSQSIDINVSFEPKSRLPKFYEEVHVEYNGTMMPVLALQGACHGHNIWLEMAMVSFGAVVQKCSSTRRLVMHNDGDIGASFKWDAEKLRPEFSIYPTSGYISPGMEVNFELKFTPSDTSLDVRKEAVKCTLEGCKPLSLTVSGSCIAPTASKETHTFETFVRQKESKQLPPITNKTNDTWVVKPIIEGEFFSGADSFTLQPLQSMVYEIDYYPLTMTNEGKRHTGSCFIPLPDGSGLLYNLVGIAGPPKPAGKIQRDVPCKTPFVEVLSVENWLSKPQRFKVIFEMVKPEKPDLTTTIKGLEYVDVPAGAKKDYKVNYYSHKEGVQQVKAVFKNERSGEFAFYELSFKAIRGGSVGSIDLVTPVRSSLTHVLKLENPLLYPVQFTANCTNNTEIMIPTSLQITAKGQGEFIFEYMPLRPGEMTAKLELSSVDLGLFIYDLNLKATPAAPEKPIYFKTTLGGTQVINAKMISFCKQKCEYTCRIDNGDFKTDKTVTAAPSQQPGGIEVGIEIVYEPSNLGESKANLILSSPIGGDYLFPLFGTCLAPKPQGPFVVKANSNLNISFKNVFASNLQFSFAIDNPLFHVSKANDTIKAHQSYKINVFFNGSDNQSNKADVMAKLIVTPPKLAGLSSNVQWIYYLKGVSQ